MEGPSIKLKNAAGFTLVEITVVIAMIAILSLIGVTALLGANNANVVDRAAQETITAIREAQNKAISTASDGTVVPAAWGVEIDASTKTVSPFYIPAASPNAKVPMTLEAKTYSQLTITPATYAAFVYSSPFGAFYSTNAASSAWTWRINPQRPRDIQPDTGFAALNANVSIVFDYRGSKRTVVVAANGDVYAE